MNRTYRMANLVYRKLIEERWPIKGNRIKVS